MSDGADWHDPFAEDPDAIDRERRRAEREAKRRGSRRSLGDKVEQAAVQPPPQPQSPGPDPNNEQPTTNNPQPPAPAEPASAPEPRSERRPPSAEPPPSNRQPAADNQRTAAQPTTTPPPPASTPLRTRRILGAAVFLLLLAILAFGVVKVIGKLTEPDPKPVKATKPEPKTKDLLIVEGLTRDQIADEVKKKVKGDYLKASDSAPKGFDLKKYDAQDAPNLEGFLFPATYPIAKKETAKELVDQQLQAFQDNFSQVDLSYAKSKNLTPYDVLIIASMIEKEIQVPEERKLAAAVIYNRLKAGDTLGIDATIRYYLRNYDQQLTESELADTSDPYNTRVIPGLPPTPIANPGLASLEAASNPAKSDVYYFVVKPGTCGEHVFVKTAEEFQQAEAAYQQALQEQGGSPTDC